ncbi:hypothetical protein BaRGS_00039950 [Batillaria attramentaria]|uniref:Uncharacterized protein n=1 Tax=Batillaria attramentaria TaxID=370345 RepID=A0ABD0J1X3_9CAEN
MAARSEEPRRVELCLFDTVALCRWHMCSRPAASEHLSLMLRESNNTNLLLICSWLADEGTAELRPAYLATPGGHREGLGAINAGSTAPPDL